MFLAAMDPSAPQLPHPRGREQSPPTFDDRTASIWHVSNLSPLVHRCQSLNHIRRLDRVCKATCGRPVLVEVVHCGDDAILESCLDVTRMWRRTDRASLAKKPSTRLSQEPCLGVKEALAGRSAVAASPTAPAGWSRNVTRWLWAEHICCRLFHRTHPTGAALFSGEFSWSVRP
jgi:hypothetical protein